jgi:DNA polymerase delta subunit OB-fold domain
MPPPRTKYVDENGNVALMLEDESGRIEMAGSRIHTEGLVTGCIIGILGTETTGGQFDVVDICLPEMAPQVPRPVKMGRVCKFLLTQTTINRIMWHLYLDSIFPENCTSPSKLISSWSFLQANSSVLTYIPFNKKPNCRTKSGPRVSPG